MTALCVRFRFLQKIVFDDKKGDTMYTTAELFDLATNADAKEVFLSNVTMSIPDDALGCVNLDAEKNRLSHHPRWFPICPSRRRCHPRICKKR